MSAPLQEAAAVAARSAAEAPATGSGSTAEQAGPAASAAAGPGSAGGSDQPWPPEDQEDQDHQDSGVCHDEEEEEEGADQEEDADQAAAAHDPEVDVLFGHSGVGRGGSQPASIQLTGAGSRVSLLLRRGSSSAQGIDGASSSATLSSMACLLPRGQELAGAVRAGQLQEYKPIPNDAHCSMLNAKPQCPRRDKDQGPSWGMGATLVSCLGSRGLECRVSGFRMRASQQFKLCKHRLTAPPTRVGALLLQACVVLGLGRIRGLGLSSPSNQPLQRGPLAFLLIQARCTPPNQHSRHS